MPFHNALLDALPPRFPTDAGMRERDHSVGLLAL